VRPSTGLLAALLLLALLGEAAALHARTERSRRGPALEAEAAVARRLGATDLCVFTEARYTRHPSQADRATPFQDHPHALEHFPSGSLAAPPR
jgi:hypothetical protein